MGQLEMFGQNIRLLIGVLLALVLAGVLIIVSWTGLRVWLFRKEQKQSEDQDRKKKLGPDGLPLPPLAPGICDRCGKAGEVFHLPNGHRFCKKCYAMIPTTG